MTTKDSGNDPFSAARIKLSDGREAYDAVKLASIPVEGIDLRNYNNHVIVVNTQNTKYTFWKRGDEVEGVAASLRGGTPTYLATKSRVVIQGSTWGGSMLKRDFVAANMHLEFDVQGATHGTITTSRVDSVQVAEIEEDFATLRVA